MILQSLNQLAKRLPDLPPNGFSLQDISFIVVLNKVNASFSIIPIEPQPIQVPGNARDSEASKDPCMFWDDTRFIFGWSKKDGSTKRNKECFDAFKSAHLAIQTKINDPDFDLLCQFLENWNPDAAADHEGLAALKSGRGVFQISGDHSYLHQKPLILAWWEKHIAQMVPKAIGQCLISGETNQPIAKVHPGIFGLPGVPYNGTSIVSFNSSAYESYGKSGTTHGKGLNAPISESAARAYTHALSYLLGDKSRRVRLGDSYIVFWTDEPADIENDFPFLFDSSKQAENAAVNNRIANYLKKLGQGVLSRDDLGDASTLFYILGISLPNKGRISIRFWHTGTLGDLAVNLQQHFDQLRIVRERDETNSEKPDNPTPSVFQLLRETAREAKDIPPLLSGALMRAILLGTPYPDTLYGAVLRRIKAERKLNYLKAAIIKAYLIRNKTKEIPIMLDTDRPEPAYRLGRLFAALEKTQEDAGNSGLRERFYSAASATPGTVFPRILRTFQHHVPKAESELAKKFNPKFAKNTMLNRESLIQEILEPISDFPSFLNLESQGLFALGYYHQRKDFYTKKEKETESEKQNQGE